MIVSEEILVILGHGRRHAVSFSAAVLITPVSMAILSIFPTTFIAFTLAIASILAGCGNEDASEPADADPAQSRVNIPWGPESLTKAEFVRRANEFCEDSLGRMLKSFSKRYQGDAVGEKFNEASQNIFLPSLQFWFDDIAYLNAPEGDKAQVEGILTSLQLAVYEGQEGRVTSPSQLSALFDTYNAKALQYGIDRCVVKENSFIS